MEVSAVLFQLSLLCDQNFTNGTFLHFSVVCAQFTAVILRGGNFRGRGHFFFVHIFPKLLSATSALVINFTLHIFPLYYNSMLSFWGVHIKLNFKIKV